MKQIFALGIMLMMAVFTSAQTTWKSDKAHSQLKFDITHTGISTVSGAFTDFEVSVTSSREDLSDAVVELTAKATSINTGIGPRDEHLRSADFFDVASFPEITFKSTGIKKVSDKVYELTGDLTMHGVTKPVTLKLEYRGSFEDPRNKKKVTGLRVTGSIKRSDFGIGTKFPGNLLSEEVIITGDGEFS